MELSQALDLTTPISSPPSPPSPSVALATHQNLLSIVTPPRSTKSVVASTSLSAHTPTSGKDSFGTWSPSLTLSAPKTLVENLQSMQSTRLPSCNQLDPRPSPPTSPSTNNLYGHCLSSKRVEDVKLNRIDKSSRSSRRRRALQRPFVFKSSPLAEGRSAGRLTIFLGNPFTHFSKITTLSRSPEPKPFDHLTRQQQQPPPPSTPSTTTKNLDSKPFHHHLGRSLRPNSFSLVTTPKRHSSYLDDFDAYQPCLSSISNSRNQNRTSLSQWVKQPKISRLHTPDKPRTSFLSCKPSHEYQKWEISLPQCTLLNFGSPA